MQSQNKCAESPSRPAFQPWPIRLSVRTRDFHSLKSSSTLLWATTVRGFVCNSRETPAFSRIIRCIPQHCHRPRFPALPERRLSALFRDRDFQSTCTVGGIFTIRRCPMQGHSGHNSRPSVSGKYMQQADHQHRFL